MKRSKKEQVSAALLGAIVGAFVFLMVVNSNELHNAQAYFWGFITYLIWGGFVAYVAVHIICKINPKANIQVNTFAIAISLLALMLINTGQAWLIQQGDTELLKQLSDLDESVESIRNKLNIDSDWDSALLNLEKSEKKLNQIKAKLVLASTMNKSNITSLKLDVLKNNIQNAKSAYEVEFYENWHEKVFVRSAYPFFLRSHTQFKSPMIVKSPVKSRPFENDLMAIIFDGHIRND